MKNLMKKMFHNPSFLVSGVFSQRKQPPSRRKGIYLLLFFSWVEFGELHSWKTEFVVILVRQLAMSRVTMNFF